MCLIIASPSGDRPDMDHVISGWSDNPDSWGLMRTSKGRVAVRKGMCTESLIAAISEIDGSPWAIHFRWATHGKKDLSNAHPFKLRNDLYMMHNGIINIDTSSDDRRSDTYHYSRYLIDIGISADSINLEEREREIGKGNKLVFMNRVGNITIANESAGDWIGGQWYSNLHSIGYQPTLSRRSLDSDVCDYCGSGGKTKLTDGFNTLCEECIAEEEYYEAYFSHHR